MKFSIGLSAKLGIALVLFCLISAVLSVAGYYYFFNNLATEQKKENLILINIDLSNNLNSILIEKIRVIQTLAASKDTMKEIENSNIKYGQISDKLRVERVKNENGTWMKATSLEDPIVNSRLNSPTAIALKNHSARNLGSYGEIFITNKYGVVVGTTGRLTTLVHNHKYWWRAAFAKGKGKIFIDDRGFDVSVNGIVLGLVVPIKKGKEVIGIIKANLNIRNILKDFIDLTVMARAYDFSIFRSGGLVILDKKHAPLSIQAPDEIAHIINRRHPIGLVRKHNNTSHIHTSAPVPITLGSSEFSFGGNQSSIDQRKGNQGEFWVISLTQNEPNFDLAKAENKGFVLFFILIFILIPSLGVWTVRRSILPLRKIINEVENFDLGNPSMGNRNYPTQEIQSLATAIDKLGERLRISTVSRDDLLKEMDQRAEAEKKAREQEWRYRSVTNSSPDAIIAIDARSKVISWNNGAERIFGYSENEMIRKPLSIIIPEDLREAHFAGLKRIIDDNKITILGETIELTALRKDGEEFPVELTLGSWKGNKEIFFSGFIRDITERKEMEQVLRQSQKMESLGNLAGGIAHDVNNMLLPIIALSEKTAKELPKGSREQLRLEKVVEAGMKARDLVAGILAFSHRSDLDVKKEDVNIFDLVQETIGLLRSTLPSTITITENLDPHTGTVHCDSSQISSILMNMASNSADAIGGHVGELSISVVHMEVSKYFASKIAGLKAGQFVKLTVSDTGMGMDAETLERIFDPFFTTKNVGEGTGLGLSMAHGIITKHGGAIDVSSAVGEGTTFDIYLPFVKTED